MTMTADQIVDRRRLRRKLSFWRVVGFLAILIIIAGAVVAAGGRNAFPLLTEPQIARVTVSGFIGEDRNRNAMLARLAPHGASRLSDTRLANDVSLATCASSPPAIILTWM